MRLLRIAEPFDHPDWLYEVNFDRFRALAHVNGHRCQLVSRNGHVFKSWPQLAEEIAHAVRAHHAVLDGEIVCLGADGCSRFHDLLFRREWPYFLAFDALAIEGEDVRALPLVERKRRLARIMPRVESRLMLLKPIRARGTRLYELACERDLEGVVAKWSKGTYQCDGRGTSWRSPFCEIAKLDSWRLQKKSRRALRDRLSCFPVTGPFALASASLTKAFASGGGPVTQLPSDSPGTATPPPCPSCGAGVRVTLRRDRLVFYACDACKAVGAYSVPERPTRLAKTPSD